MTANKYKVLSYKRPVNKTCTLINSFIFKKCHLWQISISVDFNLHWNVSKLTLGHLFTFFFRTDFSDFNIFNTYLFYVLTSNGNPNSFLILSLSLTSHLSKHHRTSVSLQAYAIAHTLLTAILAEGLITLKLKWTCCFMFSPLTCVKHP